MAKLVRVRNRGDADLVVGYNSEVTVIGPSQEAIVDREAAKAYFGDWEVTDTDKRKFRSEEYKRIRGLAGSDDQGRSAMDHLDVWEARRPHVEIIELDGAKVICVADDPLGKQVPLAKQPDLEEQMRFLKQRLEELERDREEERRASDSVTVPEDQPMAARRRPRPPTMEAAEV